MNNADFRPAHEFAVNFGVKAVIYGKPGSGKSPISIMTAPRPCVLMTEPGFMSLRKSDAPTYPAFNPSKISEFFAWAKSSNETKNYDTFVIDSGTQMAESILEEELGGVTKGGNEQHGMRAYGKMARIVMQYFNQLYFMPQKHIFIVAKLQNLEVNGMIYRRPSFPGRDLPIRVPHLFDMVLELGTFTPPGAPEGKYFKTIETFDAMARERSGMLFQYEAPDLRPLIKKASS